MTMKTSLLKAAAILCTAVLPLAAQEAAKPAPPPAPAAAPAPAAEAGTYKVAIQRPFAKGAKYALDLALSIHFEQKMGDGIAESQDIEYAVAAQVSVMGVNSIGEPTIMMIHMDKAQAGKKGAMKPMKVEGADLGFMLQKDRFQIQAKDGRKIPEEEQEMLSQVFNVPTGISEDEYLGPGKPVKPGESWSINKAAWAKALAAQMPESKKPIDPAKLDGKVTFVGLEDWKGISCIHLKVEQTDKSSEPPDFTGDSYNQVKQDLWVPVDTALNKNRAEGEQDQVVKGKIHPKDGGLVDFRQIVKVAFKGTYE